MIATFLVTNKTRRSRFFEETFLLLGKNLSDIILRSNKYIRELKKYDLVLEIIVPDLKGNFPFIAFSNSYLMINIKTISLPKLI